MFPLVQLEAKASATDTDLDADMRGYVQASQLDNKRISGWPIFNDDSVYDRGAKLIRLKHTPEDKAKGLRAYLMDIMAAL